MSSKEQAGAGRGGGEARDNMALFKQVFFKIQEELNADNSKAILDMSKLLVNKALVVWVTPCVYTEALRHCDDEEAEALLCAEFNVAEKLYRVTNMSEDSHLVPAIYPFVKMIAKGRVGVLDVDQQKLFQKWTDNEVECEYRCTVWRYGQTIRGVTRVAETVFVDVDGPRLLRRQDVKTYKCEVRMHDGAATMCVDMAK